MHVETPMTFEPGFDGGVLMCGVVVHDEVKVEVGRSLFVNDLEEFDPFLMTVPRHTCANQAAFCGIHRGKQRCRPVAFVVMGHGAATPLLDRQARLRTVQGLDLAFLVRAKNQCGAPDFLGHRIRLICATKETDDE
jgi:hypothetical protein